MANVFEHHRKGDIHIFISNGTPVMDILTRSDTQTFLDMVSSNSKTHELIVNGTYNAYSNIELFISRKPLPANKVMPTGPVVQNGKIISRFAGSGKYYIAYSEKNTKRTYYSGDGDMPKDCKSGLGGLGSLVVKGVPNDARNEYDSSVPPKAPERGVPPQRYAAHLTRRGNAMYADIEARGAAIGKIAVGLTRNERVIVGVQADGVEGVSLDEFRNMMIRSGAWSGVLLDCSNSACLAYKGKVLVSPAPYKNRSSVIGVGFKS